MSREVWLAVLLLLLAGAFTMGTMGVAKEPASLGVLELHPGAPDIGERVQVFVHADAEAYSALYVNDLPVSKIKGPGTHSFIHEVTGTQSVRLVRGNGEVMEEAVGAIPVGLAEYSGRRGESVLLLPTLKMDRALNLRLLREPIFASSQLRVMAKTHAQDAKNRVAALSAASTHFSAPRVLSRSGLVAGAVEGSGLRSLFTDASVDEILLDTPVRALLSQSVPLINATQVWAFNNSLGNITGKNVTVAVIDTGIDYTHPDLGGCNATAFQAGLCKVRSGWDYVNNDNDPIDDNGHVTHVAGIVGANGSARGVAPDVTLVAYKVLDVWGSGYSSDVIAAIENASAAGYDIISLSLGASGNADDAMSTAVDAAVNAGAVVVVAAGNSGPSAQTIGSPGTARLAITVGNTNKTDELRPTSSRGPNPITLELKPELTAPGVDIVSLALGSGNATDTGTSMSAPHVSGAAALILQVHPEWSALEVKGALVGSAKDLSLNLTDQGAGRLDALAAVNVSFVSQQPALSLGSQSSRLNNVTFRFNLSELSNRSYNVSVRAALRYGKNATLTLNQSLVQLLPLANASMELFVNFTAQPPNGEYNGLITVNSSDTNLTVRFWVTRGGWTTKLIDDTTGVSDSIYVTKIVDANQDGINDVLVAVYSFVEGYVIVESYNYSGTWSNITILETGSGNGIESSDIGNVTNLGQNDVVVGTIGVGNEDSRFHFGYYNGSHWIDRGNFLNISNITDDIEIGDVDGDGTLEVIAATYSDGLLLKIWYVNGSWNYTIIKDCSCTRPLTIDIGDVDNDNLRDIATRLVLGGNYEVMVYSFNVTSQTFDERQVSIIAGSGNQLNTVHVADPDEDNLSEVLVGGRFTGSDSYVYIYDYLGNDSWNLTTNLSVLKGTGEPVQDIAFGDIDHDGRQEMVVTLGTTTGKIFYYDYENGTYQKSPISTTLDDWNQDLDIGVATNNGLNEIVYGDAMGSDVYITYAKGPPFITRPQLDVAIVTNEGVPNFSTEIRDSDPLSTLAVYYSLDGYSWANLSMMRNGSTTFLSQHPRFDANITVQYFVRAVDDQGETNQTPIFNYTVRNLLGNLSTVQTNISNLTLKMGAQENLSRIQTGTQLVQFSANGTPYVETRFNLTRNTLDIQNTSIWVQEDNLTGWTLVKNLTVHNGTNKTVYVDHFNTTADAVCIKDAEIADIVNLSAGCSGTNETLVPCVNTTVGNYRCDNVSGRWAVYGLSHSAAKEQENPAPALSGAEPTGTVSSGSTTLTLITDEAATCKYSTSSQSYSAMPNTFSTTGGTSHSQSLSGLSSGSSYTYYFRCIDAYSKESSEASTSFSVSYGGGGGGGGGGAVKTDPWKKETTFSNPQIGEEHLLHLTNNLAAVKVGFVNSARVSSAKLTVALFNETPEEPKEGAYQYLNITLSGLSAGELSNAWVAFKVNKTWLAKNGKSAADVRLFRYAATWVELPTRWEKETDAAHYYNATTPGFSVFAIAFAPLVPLQPVSTPILPQENVSEPLVVPLPPEHEQPAWPDDGHPLAPSPRTPTKTAIPLAVGGALALVLLTLLVRRRRFLW